MNNQRNVLKAIAAASLAISCGYAAAADTQTLNVTAKVLGVCKFTTGAAIAVPFADIDPSTGTGAKTASISVPYKCTNGTAAPAVTVSSGGTTLTATGGTMAYSIGAFTTAAGAGFAAAASNATATASIAQAAWQAAVAGNYTDTVQLSITP